MLLSIGIVSPPRKTLKVAIFFDFLELKLNENEISKIINSLDKKISENTKYLQELKEDLKS